MMFALNLIRWRGTRQGWQRRVERQHQRWTCNRCCSLLHSPGGRQRALATAKAARRQKRKYRLDSTEFAWPMRDSSWSCLQASHPGGKLAWIVGSHRIVCSQAVPDYTRSLYWPQQPIAILLADDFAHNARLATT